MSAKTIAAPRAIGSYSVSLQQAAAALWDGNFWGREKISPKPPTPAVGRRAQAAARS